MSKENIVTLAIKSRVQVPRLPNFILFKDSDNKIPVEQLTEEDIRAIGSVWIEAFIQHAETRRNQNT